MTNCTHLIATLLTIAIVTGNIITFNTVYGDGLFMEQLSASFGDRKADLLIKMNPPIVTTQTIEQQGEKPTVQFRLFDSKTDQNFKEVTYLITVEKGDKKLMTDWFFNPDGNLTIEMQPRNQSQVRVNGELDPILNAYTSSESNPVVASGPIFLDGGLYHFNVRIVTVDFSRTIIPDDQQPVFDGWLSIGATNNVNLNVNGKSMPVTLISYYDKVGNATFHPNNNSISFTMPFNYDLKRLNDPKNNVFIHEEVHVPKPSIFTKPGSYVAYANDKDVTNNIMVDGNNQSKDVVHYMIAKPLALQIADAYNKSHPNDPNGMMTFSLLPSTNGSKSMAGGGGMNMSSMPSGVGGAK
ncbi:MAG: hypothetical protein R2685_17190 [Candidatus Nitrosocosmicus sp.]|jgi:hypothetical protein|nr:hypothetical protein [Candidatus Nitrosocosmicus sp.]